jgi:hypothetical protein
MNLGLKQESRKNQDWVSFLRASSLCCDVILRRKPKDLVFITALMRDASLRAQHDIGGFSCIRTSLVAGMKDDPREVNEFVDTLALVYRLSAPVTIVTMAM